MNWLRSLWAVVVCKYYCWKLLRLLKHASREERTQIADKLQEALARARRR